MTLYFCNNLCFIQFNKLVDIKLCKIMLAKRFYT